MDLIGKMDKVCVLKQNTPGTLGAGAVDSYATLLTTRGWLRKSSGNRSLSFGDLVGNDSWKLTVRKENALVNNLRHDLKWVIDGRTFTIQTWTNVGERSFYYEFELTEQRA